ncbi:NAD-dependent epimerase/dehydratase family protein [Candidatus Thioglobus sp.]|nr:NAD-dependent epimerase/dehydratase family protein [Candidatus Thioglobus sp.]
MKKVLITGGAGFIGYHLANKLLESGYHVDLLDNFSRGVNDFHLESLAKNDRVNCINFDLLQSEKISQLEQDYKYIYHLAAVIGVQHVLKAPYEVLTKNFILLNNAIEIAKKQNKLERFVFASTSEVYAGTLNHYGLQFPTPESTPLTINNTEQARSSYMLSKIYGEAMCQHSGLPITIIRPHNFYGPRMGLSHVIPELMKKAVDTKLGSIDVYSVTHKRTFCYIMDAVDIIQLLAESTNSIGRVFNVGNDDEEISMGELAQGIINLTGKSVTINSLESTPGSPERRCPSINDLKEVEAYVKQYTLEKGLQETFDWYSKNVFSGQVISAI